jgi:polyphosphate kinase
LRARVMKEGLAPYLEDNTHAWEMRPDGTYARRRRGKLPALSAQDELLEKMRAG